MARGFIYVVATVTRDYLQPSFRCVPTEWKGRLCFGPCKIPMRPRMEPGDWVFGISPSNGMPRRIVFAVELEERLTFADAYDRFPDLRGPDGPIHVSPVNGAGRFPESSYRHIPGANHADNWIADLASEKLDAFFVGRARDGWHGRWLGGHGPVLDDEILGFLRTCSVYGRAGLLGATNSDATAGKPVRHGDLCKGLHLETDRAEYLLGLLSTRAPRPSVLDRVVTPLRGSVPSGGCDVRQGAPTSHPVRSARLVKSRC